MLAVILFAALTGVSPVWALSPQEQNVIDHFKAHPYKMMPVIGDLTETEADYLYLVFPPELREQIEAQPQLKRKLTFERYGLPLNPATQMPYALTPIGRSRWRMTCLICHSGNIPNPDGSSAFAVGVPNREVDISTYFEDRSRLLKQFPKYVDQDLVRSVSYRVFRDGFAVNPIAENRGLVNAWGLFGMISSSRNLDFSPSLEGIARLAAGNPYDYGITACDMDPISWWGVRFRERIYSDGFLPNKSKMLLNILMAVGNPVKKWEHDFEGLYQGIRALNPPQFTGVVDRAKAKRGQAAFDRTCAKCHGTYFADGDVGYPSKTIELAKVGTDPLRLEKGITLEYRQFIKNSWTGNFGKEDIRLNPVGYTPPVLKGIWATAPYFHNGSVPTLYDVLHPSTRPAVWKSQSPRYDFQKVGLAYRTDVDRAAMKDANDQRKVYVTSMPGKSSAGHPFADQLSESEKDEVLEYLKTL